MYATPQSQNASYVFLCPENSCTFLADSYQSVITHLKTTHNTLSKHLPSESTILKSLRKLTTRTLYPCTHPDCKVIVSRLKALKFHLTQHHNEENETVEEFAARVHLCPKPTCSYFSSNGWTAIHSHLINFHQILNPKDCWFFNWWFEEWNQNDGSESRLNRLIRCRGSDICKFIASAETMVEHFAVEHGLSVDGADDPTKDSRQGSEYWEEYEFAGFVCPIPKVNGRCPSFESTIDDLADHIRIAHSESSQRKPEAKSVFEMEKEYLERSNGKKRSVEDMLLDSDAASSPLKIPRTDTMSENDMQPSTKEDDANTITYEIPTPRTSNNLFYCPFKNCTHKTNRRSAFKDHYGRIHLKVRTKICPNCDRWFYNQNDLRKHMVRESNRKGVVKQETVVSTLDSEINEMVLLDNQEIVSVKITYKQGTIDSKQIDRMLDSVLSSVAESSTEIPRRYPCPIENCERRFLRIDNLREHLQMHCNKLQCEICEKSFAKARDWDLHLQSADHFLCVFDRRKIGSYYPDSLISMDGEEK